MKTRSARREPWPKIEVQFRDDTLAPSKKAKPVKTSTPKAEPNKVDRKASKLIFEDDLQPRIDQVTELMRKKYPMLNLNETNAIRSLLMKGLEQIEREQ